MFQHIRGILKVGLREYLKQVWYLREFRGGVFVGRDVYGNKYYEMSDSKLPFYRKRYVALVDGSDEPSKVPANWHGWLHYINDDAPSKSNAYSYPEWGTKHIENLTGSPQNYVPYSTTVRQLGIYSPKELNWSNAFQMGNPTLPSGNNQRHRSLGINP